MIGIETPDGIQTRDDLIYALSLAAELEHGICLQYLYAAYTLKTNPEEGLTAAEAAMVNQWETDLLEIARQEMGHVGLVNNLLTAIGGSPHFHRPNFPQAHRYGDTQIHLRLRPLTRATLQAFIEFEKPQPPLEAADAHTPVPTPFSYASIQELYWFIEDGFERLEAKLANKENKETLFIGPPEAQIDSARIGLRNERPIYDVKLTRVTNLQEAKKAIQQIVVEGEGASADVPSADSHYKRLTEIDGQYPKNGEFVPHRDVIDNPATREDRLRGSDKANLIEDPFTLKVAHLSNAAYEILLLTLIRFYGHIDATEKELATLQYTSFFPLMVMVVRPAAELLSTLPAGREKHGAKRAGPPFEFYGHVQLLPHRRSAWRVLYEKLNEMAVYCEALATEADKNARAEIRAAAPRLEFMRQNTWRIAHDFKMAMGVS